MPQRFSPWILRRDHPNWFHASGLLNRYCRCVSPGEKGTLQHLWSGGPMPRSNPSHGLRRQAWLIGLVLVTGCAQLRTDLQDTLARRVMPDEVTSGQLTSRDEGKGDRATTDANVRPAAAAQPGPGAQARSEGDRSSAIPPAIVEPPQRTNSDHSSPAPSLPSDSDQATLEAIAASGKPLTVSEAIDVAFRSQPRLRAQLENIDQARGLQQIAFSAFLPAAGLRFDGGGFRLGRKVFRPKSGVFLPSYPASERCWSARTSRRPSI